VAHLAAASSGLLERLCAAAEARRAYDRRDPEPCDLSILPRVVTAAEAATLAEPCRRIVEASLARALDLHAGRETAAGWPLAWITAAIGRLPEELFGNVRLDFLPSAAGPKFLEAGWVNLSGVDYAPQAALAVLDVEPSLAETFTIERPVAGIRRRLLEQGVRRLAILVKDDHTVYAEGDWELIREALAPIESLVVSERDFGRLQPAAGAVLVDGQPCDAVYLRALDGPAAFTGPRAAANRQTLEMLLAAGVMFHDHPLLLAVEDKNLAWLVESDPALAAVVPETRPPAAVPPEEAAGWVLKLRDRHSGEGVFLDEAEMRRHWHDPAAILQRRIEPERVEVVTVHGHRGLAVADLAVHVSYRYAVRRRELLAAEITGYFSRFSLTGGKVNLCAGGGIVPVLSEAIPEAT